MSPQAKIWENIKEKWRCRQIFLWGEEETKQLIFKIPQEKNSPTFWGDLPLLFSIKRIHVRGYIHYFSSSANLQLTFLLKQWYIQGPKQRKRKKSDLLVSNFLLWIMVVISIREKNSRAIFVSHNLWNFFIIKN